MLLHLVDPTVLDPTLLAAIIGAVAVIVSSIISRFSGMRSQKRSDAYLVEKAEKDAFRLKLRHAKLEDQALTSASSFYEKHFELFGFKTRRVVTVMKVHNFDGDCTITRQWQGVQAHEGSSISTMGGRFWLSGPKAEFGSMPELVDYNDNDFVKHVSLTSKQESRWHYNYIVEINPPMVVGDPVLNYEIAIHHKKAVLLDRDAIAHAYGTDLFPYDFYCFDVYLPIGELVIEVEFPLSCNCVPHAAVFFGHSEVRHSKELERSLPGFDLTARGARFNIENPRIGFRYAIYWDGAEHDINTQVAKAEE